MLNLLDLAQRTGERPAAIVDEITTVAPEWSVIPAIPQTGTSYEIMRRVGIPAGSFRAVGSGVPLSKKSQWEKDKGSMYLFEAQMAIGEDVMKAMRANMVTLTDGDILADEAAANAEGSVNLFGTQTYYGNKAAKDGFVGISNLVAQEVSAGAADNVSSTSAYLTWLDDSETNPQGLHFRVGDNGAFTFGDWFKQRVEVESGKFANQMLNNFLFFVGLAVASDQSVFRVRNITIANPLTDLLAAELLSKVALNRRKNLRWFLNKTAGYTLQASRSGLQLNQGQGGNFAPTPTEICGIPITYTDSIADTEKAGVLAS